MIVLRRAVSEDIPDIMRFMDEHWKPGNILAKNRGFFEWQFMDGDKLNIFIGIDEDAGKIYGMVGAIVYSKSLNPDVSGCTWQVIKSENPILGIELSEYMFSQMNARYSWAAGISKKAVKINQLRGCAITEMDHYYRLANREEFKIAKIIDKTIPAAEETRYSLESICSVGEMKKVIPEKKLADQIPGKDYFYIEKRYFEHPIYHYDIWKIVDEKGCAQSIVITRDEMMQDKKICKIVDHYGKIEDLGKIALALDRLMEERGYEFVDVYSYGVPIGIYERGGFVRCDATSKNIIPNYFHPFVQKNVSLKMVKPTIEGVRLFRGDGDQDRPC